MPFLRPSGWTLAAVAGNVEIKRNADTVWSPAQDDTLFYRGDEIRTGEDGKCILRNTSGEMILAGNNTSLRFIIAEFDPEKKSARAKIHLSGGVIVFTADSGKAGNNSFFQISTPQGTAVVFRARAMVKTDTKGNTAFICDKGEMAVIPHSGKSEQLSGGYKMVFSPYSIAAPAPVAPSDKSEIAHFVSVEMKDALTIAKNKYRRNNLISCGGDPGNATLLITFPPEGFVTKDHSLTITGCSFVNDNISIGGNPVVLNSGGRFSKEIALDEGNNRIAVSYGSTENKQTMELGVVKDTIPPALLLMTPSRTLDTGSGICDMEPSGALRCLIEGKTEPGAALSLNNKQCAVMQDGFFSCETHAPAGVSTISVIAKDAAGNISAETLSKSNADIYGISRILLAATPDTVTANGLGSSTISITALNARGEPVPSGTVFLSVSSGGTISPASVTISGGSGSAIFSAGVGFTRNAAAITATAPATSVSSTVSITLLPSVPPPLPEN